VHEAGHSVLARVLGLRAGRATIRDSDGRAKSYFSPGDSIDGVLAALAGRAATEELPTNSDAQPTTARRSSC
jgi:hypothetical protein